MWNGSRARRRSEFLPELRSGYERGDGIMATVVISVFTMIFTIELSIMNDNLSKIARELERIRREVTE